MNEQPNVNPQNGTPIPPARAAHPQNGSAPYGTPPAPPQAAAQQPAAQRQQQPPVQQPGQPGQPWDQYRQPVSGTAGAQQRPQQPTPQPGQQQPTSQYPAQGFQGQPVQAGRPIQQGQPRLGTPQQVPLTTQTPKNSDPNFIRALFDLNFEHFVAIKFAKVIYVLGIALNLLAWLGWVVFFFIAGAATNSMSYYGNEGGFLIILGVLALLFGWIFVLINVIVLRVVIELVIAQVRTAQNTTKLAAHSA